MMSVEISIDEKSPSVTLFNKVDYRVKSLELAVSMFEPLRSDDARSVDDVAACVLKLADRFLEHFRNGNRHL